jgi:predicted negative regulator of RcsB-dependent stress response
MAFRDIKRIVSEWYQINVEPSFEATRSHGYFREMIIGVCGALIIVGGVWGYKYYNNKREAGAQIAFAENVQIYHEALQGKADVWPHVEMKCGSDYERYKSSSLAPYFLIIKADALAHQAKIVEACKILDTAIALLPKDSPVLALYKTKRALMKIDMPDNAKQTEGLEELRQLGADKTNLNNDVAQYYLGLYYWSHDDLTKSLEVWKELVTSQAAEKLASSPWASLAREKLAQRCMLPENAPIEAPKAEA